MLTDNERLPHGAECVEDREETGRSKARALVECHRAIRILSRWLIDAAFEIDWEPRFDGRLYASDASLDVTIAGGQVTLSMIPPDDFKRHGWEIFMRSEDGEKFGHDFGVELAGALSRTIQDFDPEPQDYGWSQ